MMSSDASQDIEKKSRFKVKNVVPGEVADATVADKASLPTAQDYQSFGVEQKLSGDSTLKKSRFTVKTVPKEEEKQSLSINQINGDVTTNIIECIQQQNKSIRQIERMVEMNYQMLHKLLETKNLPATDTTHQVRSNETEPLATAQFKEKLILRDNPIESQPSSIQTSQSSLAAKDKDKDKDKEKGFGKMSHYLAEVKKELDSFQKQRKEMQLEMQRLREKCQQLEDQLSIEQSKVVTIEDRLERSKTNQRGLQAQVEAQNLKLERQLSLLEAQNKLISTPNTVFYDQLSTSTDQLRQQSDKFSQPPTANISLGSNKSADNIQVLTAPQSKDSSDLTVSRPLRSLSFDSK